MPVADGVGQVGAVLQYARPLSAPVARTSRDWAKGALYGVLGAVATCTMMASLLLRSGAEQYRGTGVALLAAAAFLTVVGVVLAVVSGRKVNSTVTSGNITKEIR
ncbi:hypothetical protein I0C86_40680 [Plantactinospora sp. S1510]|uniref:Uncharacterized protein n=1 Tax=Plantactinospora alkalitolerans TaxID=2789879 RepID=A0ABS0H9N4_9ACTN|nr:hypothetical protein [Plantactinospora alkalitolerans]MBF9135197.1 hypothetical protein [Plantactinospora alkalitolerans]